jgi:hypothetical protein
MQVTEEADKWPEDQSRRRLWLRPSEALQRQDDPGLRDIIRAAWRVLRRERREQRRRLRSG